MEAARERSHRTARRCVRSSAPHPNGRRTDPSAALPRRSRVTPSGISLERPLAWRGGCRQRPTARRCAPREQHDVQGERPRPMNMPVRFLLALGGTLLLALSLAPVSSAAAFDGRQAREVLSFETAFANVSPFIGAAGTIRGVPAAGLPWAIRAVRGDLRANRELTVAVRGLVLADDPSLPANLPGP